MRVAVDTNVLIRFLLADDASQAAAAATALERYQTLHVSTVVLCELIWVLRRVYRFDRSRLIDAITALMDHTRVETDLPAFAAGLAMLEAGGDFADGCLLQEADRRRCETVLSFDKRFVARSNGRATLLETA